ncbi:hypothetical protein C2I18_28970 [Paenibacillus sp. PK3_47]|uniref:hypothetical protein n=1 Tax=Paenibacillus sp. PK3_47 TaxID=2072642 RepID=UPI00201E36AF|nr:hypothetical protein [Paenibacillus sp. PK3_47]UQZ37218.1 hypothetical protein C2I18_28970 [Paenibacillus sp. PK3_47]
MTRYLTGILVAALLTVTLTAGTGLPRQEKVGNLAYTSMHKEKSKLSDKVKSLFNGILGHMGSHSH